MLEQTLALARRLLDWHRQARSRPGYRIFLGALSLGFLAAVVWFIWKQVSGGYATVTTAGLSLEPWRLAVSWFCTAAATALGAWEWVLLVRALGGQLDLTQGMSIQLTSNLAKYVPGFIWSYAGKGYLAVRQGVPAGIATVSIAGEFAIVYICGALLAVLSLPFSDLISLPVGGRVGLQMIAVSAAVLAIIGLPPLVRRLALRARVTRTQSEPFLSARWPSIAFVMAAVLMTWCLLAFGFSVLYGQPLSGGWSHLLRHSIALVGAMLLGQLAFFAPTGVGVREAVLVALLASQGSAAEVLILAVVFRLEMILGEVVCAMAAVAAVRLRRAWQAHSRANNTNG